MTIEDVIATVEEETGQQVTPETELKSLGLDSLEFLDLMIKLSIPDKYVPYIDTVQELYLVANAEVSS